jgi:hypothetical protein
MHDAYAPDKLVYDAPTGILRLTYEVSALKDRKCAVGKGRSGRYAHTPSVHRSLIETEVAAQTFMQRDGESGHLAAPLLLLLTEVLQFTALPRKLRIPYDQKCASRAMCPVTQREPVALLDDRGQSGQVRGEVLF